MVHSTSQQRPNQGIRWAQGKSLPEVAEFATQQWYDEIQSYPWPCQYQFNMATGHFTQVHLFFEPFLMIFEISVNLNIKCVSTKKIHLKIWIVVLLEAFQRSSRGVSN